MGCEEVWDREKGRGSGATSPVKRASGLRGITEWTRGLEGSGPGREDRVEPPREGRG